MIDPLEAAILTGAAAALRRKAAELADRARWGTTESDKVPGVLIRTSEAAHAARLARELASIAEELEQP